VRRVYRKKNLPKLAEAVKFDSAFVSFARNLYLEHVENPPWVPHEFSPKKFKLAQICTLVDILHYSAFVRSIAKCNPPADVELIKRQFEDPMGLVRVLHRVTPAAPSLVQVGPLNHRRLTQLLATSPELKAALELTRVPHYSTIAKLEARLKTLSEQRAAQRPMRA
jgi:hypothetical protein